jgi:prepilin peptidase CpaA
LITLPLYIFILVELMAVGYLDFKTKKILNYWSILNIAIFVGFLIFWSDVYSISAQTIFFPIVFLVVGYVLFMVKIMGAGDSKYLFSLFLLVPNQYHEDFFTCIAYTTVIIGLILLTRNLIKNKEFIIAFFRYGNPQLIKNVLGKKFSFAPVILFSWIWFGWNYWSQYDIP